MIGHGKLKQGLNRLVGLLVLESITIHMPQAGADQSLQSRITGDVQKYGVISMFLIRSRVITGPGRQSHLEEECVVSESGVLLTQLWHVRHRDKQEHRPPGLIQRN
jgi:hypothetical protein